MQKERKKLNQAGMSLMELIVVILIMGILAAGSAVGIAYIGSMNATSAVEKLESLLERTRLHTLSADDTVKLVLKKEGNEYYGILMEGSIEADKVKLGGDSLHIQATTETGTATDISSTNCIIAYKKSNGAFEDTCPYTSIIVEGSKTRIIQLVKATGRSYIN